jgi:hypothetical protein
MNTTHRDLRSLVQLYPQSWRGNANVSDLALHLLISQYLTTKEVHTRVVFISIFICPQSFTLSSLCPDSLCLGYRRIVITLLAFFEVLSDMGGFVVSLIVSRGPGVLALTSLDVVCVD